jgi:hypothetical protein
MSPNSRQRAHNQNTRGIDVFLTLLRQLGTLGLYTHLLEMGLTTAEIAMLDIASKDLGWKMVEDHVAKGEIYKALSYPESNPESNTEERRQWKRWTYQELLDKLSNLITQQSQFYYYSRLWFSRNSKDPVDPWHERREPVATLLSWSGKETLVDFIKSSFICTASDGITSFRPSEVPASSNDSEARPAGSRRYTKPKERPDIFDLQSQETESSE